MNITEFTTLVNRAHAKKHHIALNIELMDDTINKMTQLGLSEAVIRNYKTEFNREYIIKELEELCSAIK